MNHLSSYDIINEYYDCYSRDIINLKLIIIQAVYLYSNNVNIYYSKSQ